MNRKTAIDKVIASFAEWVWNPATGTGVRETGGANRGPRIDQANRFTGVALRSPWCASSLALAADEAIGAVYPVPRTAACDVILSWGRKRKLLHRTALRGDIFLIMNPSDEDDATHTGLVEYATENGVATIEGNTNDAGGREGVACLRRNRPYSSRILFVRWADMLEDTADEDEIESAGGATWKVFFGPKEAPTKILPGVVDGNAVFVDFTDLMAHLHGGAAAQLIGWEPEEGGVTWGGAPVPQSIPRRIIDGNTFVGVRLVAAWQGLAVEPFVEEKAVRIYRPAM